MNALVCDICHCNSAEQSLTWRRAMTMQTPGDTHAPGEPVYTDVCNLCWDYMVSGRTNSMPTNPMPMGSSGPDNTTAPAPAPM